MDEDVTAALRSSGAWDAVMPGPARSFVEWVTSAGADRIVAAVDSSLERDWMALPVWARNLAYRLACLQRPEDAQLLAEAAVDLYSFGPDNDDRARGLAARAAELGGPDHRAQLGGGPRA